MLTTFTRIKTDDIDALIDDEELVLTLVNQLGFDAKSILQMASDGDNADPETLFQTLENRWNGQGQIFSLENQTELLESITSNRDELANTPLAKLSQSGRAIPITNDGEHIRLLFPDQIDAINDSLISLPIENLQAIAEKLTQHSKLNTQHAELISAPLWQLYDGLCTFFQNAVDQDEFILLAKHEE